MPAAIVTGSSRGIGKGIAIRLAQDGYDVIVNDIGRQQQAIDETVEEIRASGRKAHGFVADVSSQSEVQAMIAEAVKEFGELTVMVANAGVLDTTSLLDMTPEVWDKVYSVNARGVFLCYAEAAKQMIKQGNGGRIIGACSVSGYRPSGKCPAYCSSKWAVRGLTQSSALELGEHGITVCAYCPGSVKTDMSTIFAARLAKERAARGEPELSVEETYKQSAHRKTAIGRELFPADIAGLVSFLASKDSSGMTGQTIIVDGGESITPSPHKSSQANSASGMYFS